MKEKSANTLLGDAASLCLSCFEYGDENNKLMLADIRRCQEGVRARLKESVTMDLPDGLDPGYIVAVDKYCHTCNRKQEPWVSNMFEGYVNHI